MWSASWLFVGAAQREHFFSARRQRPRAHGGHAASRRAISAAQRRLTLTPFCSEKRENAHFPLTFSSFCLEPKGKNVQLLEIYPAVQKVRSGSVVLTVPSHPSENDRYTGLSAPLAVTPRRPPEPSGERPGSPRDVAPYAPRCALGHSRFGSLIPWSGPPTPEGTAHALLEPRLLYGEACCSHPPHPRGCSAPP